MRAGAIWLTVAPVAVAGVIVADMRPAAGRRRLWRPSVGLATIALFCTLFDLLAVVVRDDGPGQRMTTPTADDLRPLPETLRIVSISDCDGGSGGTCTRQFRIAATDRAARAVIVDRLIRSLQANGWSISASDKFGNGCRTLPGRVLYVDHCLVVGIDRNLDWISDVPPDQVVIQIDNAD